MLSGSVRQALFHKKPGWMIQESRWGKTYFGTSAFNFDHPNHSLIIAKVLSILDIDEEEHVEAVCGA